MKVLIAIDHSPMAKAVMEHVSRQTWNDDTTFMVLNVVAVPDERYWQDRGLTVPQALMEKLIKTAQERVIANVAQLRNLLDEEFMVAGKVCFGHASDGILHVSKEWQADLIVLGTHGYTGLKKLVLGSVAERVLEQAPCSVEVVRPPAEATVHRPIKKKLTVLY